MSLWKPPSLGGVRDPATRAALMGLTRKLEAVDGSLAGVGDPDTAIAAHVAETDPHSQYQRYGSLTLPLGTPTASNGTWATSAGSNAQYLLNATSPANGNYWEKANVPLGGTYTVDVILLGASTAPRVQVSIDGTNVGSLFDSYNATTLVMTHSTPDVAITDGLHAVRLTINGRHASSSGWTLRVMNVYFTRTS